VSSREKKRAIFCENLCRIDRIAKGELHGEHARHKIAHCIGVKDTTYNSYLQGRAWPPPDVLDNLLNFYGKHLGLSLSLHDLLDPNLKLPDRRLLARIPFDSCGGVMEVSIRHARDFREAHRNAFDRWLNPLLRNESIDTAIYSDADSASLRRAFEVFENGLLRFSFRSTESTETNANEEAVNSQVTKAFNELRPPYNQLEVHVVPLIDRIREDLSLAQGLRITILAADFCKFLSEYSGKQCSDPKQRARASRYLGISGGFHVRQICQTADSETLGAFTGVVPLSTMSTEHIESPGAVVSSDILELPKVRANRLVHELAQRAGQRDFHTEYLHWYPPDEIDRSRLVPERIESYSDKKRCALERQYGDLPWVAQAFIEKINEIDDYVRDLEHVDMTVVSLGHLDPAHEDQRKKLARGAVGNFLFRYVDKLGHQPREFRIENAQPLGPPLSWFRKRIQQGLPTVVLATGHAKLPILLAAVRGQLCNVIFTDATLANELLQSLK